MLRQIAPQYIDTGKLKVVYRHFAYIGNESQWAGEAAECAGEQNKFWDYSTYIFTHQAGENAGSFSQANLENFAAQMKLDTSKFNACLESGKYLDVVKQDSNEAMSRAVRATPTFFLNGQRIEGLMTADQLSQAIDGKLGLK